MTKAIWDKFCAQYDVVNSCVPLFAVGQDGNVRTKTIGRDHEREILMRSEEMDAMILSVTDRLVEDWHSRSRQYDGMIYTMGWKQSGMFVPLYIGKTETFGIGDGNLSANIQNLHTNRRNFARWGDNYAYHIGDLSAWVLPGHSDDKKRKNYQAWASCLFDAGTRLKQPVYFWAYPWERSDAGLWEELGPKSLAVLEHCLIAVADGISPCLLNLQGRPR